MITDFPDIHRGTQWRDISARQWRNVFDVVKRIANMTVGPGLTIRNQGTTLNVGLQSTPAMTATGKPMDVLGIIWVIVRNIPYPNENKLEAQQVQPKINDDNGWEGEWETMGEKFDVLTYPNQRAGEFEVYIWPEGAPINDQANILPAIQIGAYHWLWQYIPYHPRRLPENMVFGDCQPPGGT